MYTINHIKDSGKALNYIEIKNSSHTSSAKIYLEMGASLQELTLKNEALIEDLAPLEYSSTYASSILFPFANRIKDGAYHFENKPYTFKINEVANNNALHGLVFNKTFEVIKKNITENFASVTLIYEEGNKSVGFPYTYSIQLEYILTETSLDLKVSIKNTGSKLFPFTLGWHPYFLSRNLKDSYLNFKSSKKLVFDDRMITKHIEDYSNTSEFKIENKSLDDCWVLDDTKVNFKTPNYNLQIRSSEKNSFLQAYTPPRKNTIAIEPTTGVSDSFNNKIGLQNLAPKDTYQLTWTLKLN